MLEEIILYIFMFYFIILNFNSFIIISYFVRPTLMFFVNFNNRPTLMCFAFPFVSPFFVVRLVRKATTTILKYCLNICLLLLSYFFVVTKQQQCSDQSLTALLTVLYVCM